MQPTCALLKHACLDAGPRRLSTVRGHVMETFSVGFLTPVETSTPPFELIRSEIGRYDI